MRIVELTSIATGRSSSLFTGDVRRRSADLQTALQGARVLVIGGAGSIGSATVGEILRYQPGVLHVVDVSENNLAELVRDLRGSGMLDGIEFRPVPLDYGSPLMHRFLLAEAPYEYVFNFAAVKHVRSERDVCSLLHMIDTNILKQAALMAWLESGLRAHHYFSVSTDKAANPVNLMGATKRFAEHVVFASGLAMTGCSVTSARFANVAFSDGSLLHGWINRLDKRQPIAVPGEARRYFISLEEAGQICLLAGVVADSGQVLIPRLDADVELRDLQAVAHAFLEAHGFRPVVYTNEEEATAAVSHLRAEGSYPLLVTPLDTTGEKPYEEFVGDGEQAIEIGMKYLKGVRISALDASAVAAALETFQRGIADPAVPIAKEDVVAALLQAMPFLRHSETGRSLDERL